MEIKPNESVLIAEKTKDCPTCGKKLKAADGICPTCGATFEVQTRAYCTRDHKLIVTDADGKCPDCAGSDLLDPRLFSKLIAAGTPPGISPTRETPLAAAPAASADTRQCPRCAETIKAEARLCRFCGARFEVSVKGYCTNCHAQVALDGNDRCSQCGGEIVDRQITSTLLGPVIPVNTPQVPPPSPGPIPAAQPAPFTPSAVVIATASVTQTSMPLAQLYFSPKGRIGRLTFFLKGMLPVFISIGICGVILMSLTSSVQSSGSSGTASIFISIGMLLLLGGILALYWAFFMLMIKRFHDLDRSGWNILVWLIPLYGSIMSLVNWVEFFFRSGTIGPNRFGDPSA